MSDGSLVVVKSVPDFWRREFIGNKPNTIRIMSEKESQERIGLADMCMEAGEPASIEVINTETGEHFFRRITDISQVGAIAGQFVWLISWQHEKGVGTYSDEEATDAE